MSEEDEGGGPSYDSYEVPEGRRRTVGLSSNHSATDYATYRQPPPQPQYTRSGASLKPPPPSSVTTNKSKASLLDDDSDGDPYPAGTGGRADYPGMARGRSRGSDMGGANYGMSQSGVPGNTPTSWGDPDLAIPATNGRSTLMPGLGYGYALPEDDQKGQHKERRTLMKPEQPPPPNASARKAPPQSINSNLYPRKDPPKAPVGTVDFLARLTAQIDQPDEETLMTQHAQKTLLEIQHTTGGRRLGGGTGGDEGPASLMHADLEGQDSSSQPSLPEATEGRKKVSTIFSHKVQKPLEPSGQSRRLRRPPTRQVAVDVMAGLSGGSITMLDHRLHCYACGVPLVAAKSVILVVCPSCRCKFPNDRVGGPTSAKSPARGGINKEYSC